jgi:peptidoglycan hydrolase CwlO-like protein
MMGYWARLTSRKVKPLFLAFMAILVVGIFTVPVATQAVTTCRTIAECNTQRAELNTRLNQTRAAQEAARARARELARIVNELTAQINATQRQINQTQAQIDQIEAQIADLEEQIRQKQIELAIQKENQREAIRLLYESGGGSTLEILLGHDTLADAVTQTEYLDALEEKVEETIDIIEELKRQLALQKQDLEGKRAVQLELKRTLEAQRSQMSAQRSLQQQALNDANANLTDLNRQVNDLNREIRAVDGSISAFLRSSFANSSGNMIVVNNSPHYYQWSEPWGPQLIWEDTMTESGCLITDIAMVSRMMGKNVGTPGDFLAAMKKNGALFYDLVAWGSALSASTGGLTWTRNYGADFATINRELALGFPVIVQMAGWHWVVVTGYNAGNGTYSVNDPYFANRSYPTAAVTGFVTVR